jgi:RNA polymerase sigma-70 factor, ECF subfamily
LANSCCYYDSRRTPFFDTDVVNDPCSTANAAVPAGFAGSLAADWFIGNVGRNRRVVTLSHDQQDQTGAFVEHVINMQRNLFAYILTLLPNLENANEVLQQTNLVLWSKRDEFRPGSNAQAWACRIAYYEVLAYRQRGRRERLRFDNDLLEQMAGEAVTQCADPETELQALARCTDKLSSSDRNLLDLRYQDTLSSGQIAAKVGRSAVAIRKALFRIRALLHRCVEERLKTEEQNDHR